jgi:type II secretion system protein D
MKMRSRIVMAAGLAAAAGWPVSLSAQEGAPAGAPGSPSSEQAAAPAAVPPSATDTPKADPNPGVEGGASSPAAQPVVAQPAQPAVQPTAAPPAQPVKIKFNFKDAPFDQVLDFFSRESGLPPIREVPVPEGTMTFISGEAYSFEDALTILNLNLQPRGVQVQREANFLHLRSLKDSVRKAGDVVSGTVPSGMRPEKIVNLTIPLSNIKADVVVEQIKPLIGEYGSVQAVPAQNMLIIVETAAQCRRIQQIVSAIDSIKPVDSAFKLFPLKHAKCDAVFNALKGLVGQRKTTVVIDKDNKQRTIEEVDIAGLNLQPDPRTNSIIAVGPAARISVVEELIALLDVPEGESIDGSVVTFVLDAIAPAKAAEDLNKLFAAVEVAKKPVVVPLDGQGKVTVVAAEPFMSQAKALIAEIDPGSVKTGGGSGPLAERRATIVRLTHITPAAVESLAPKLLSGRQTATVKFAAAPDGRGIIVSGPDADVTAMEKLIAGLDVPGQGAKDIRRIAIINGNGKAVLERAQAIYKSQMDGVVGVGAVEATLDEGGASVLVIAAPEAMQRFAKIVEELGRHVGQNRDIRLVELRFAPAAKVKAFMDDMVKSSASFRAKGDPDPVFEVIEANNSLMIAAQPAQFAIIEALVKNLDLQQGAERPPLRILRLKATDAASVATILQASFDRRPTEQKAKKPVDITADGATNTLIVSAHPDAMPEIETLVNELNLQQAYDAEGREIRIFPLKIARAEELAKTIDAMYPEPPVPRDPRNGQPRPDLQRAREVVVRADRGTNSLIVDAPAKRLAGFEQIVKSLDAQKLGANVELRTYRVERADLNAAATAIRNGSASGALSATGGGAATSVTVDVEPMSRTLVVSGPSDVFKGVEEVLKKVDAAPERPATGVKMYALKSARAERLQPLVQKVIVSRAKEQQAASGKGGVDVSLLVDVAGESASNTLIVSAPESVLTVCDALIQTLDSQGVASATEMRVFRLERGDAAGAAGAISKALAADAAGDPAPTVTPEVSSNSIVMVGTRGQIEKAQKLIEQLDAVTQKNGVGARTIKLKHARAEVIAPVLETLLKKESVVSMLPSWERGDYLARSGYKAEEGVRVAAEKSINAIIVTAPVAALDAAEQIIAELDVDPATISGRLERPVRIITLQNADATELASSVQAVLAEERSGVEPAVVRVDKASNSLIVRAGAEQMKSIEELAQRLDSATLSSSRQMRMISVDRSKADAELMARTLQKLLEQQGGVKVEVIPAEQLLRKEEPKKTGNVAPFRGPGGPVGAFMQVWIAAAVAWQPEAPKAAQQETAGVTIAVDPATNSLIVVGSPRLTDRLAALAAELEKQMPAEASKVRIVGLPPAADAEALSQIIRQTVQQLGRVGPGNAGGFTGAVSVMPDPAGTALIVWANDTDFSSVGDLIRAVSHLEPAGSVTVKVYPLASVTAERAIRAVQDLVSVSPRGAQARRLRGPGGGPMEVTVKGPHGKDVKGTIDPALVRLSADPAGVSIIVAAPAATLPLIDSFISLIDQSPVQDRMSIRRYDLLNARAQELSQTLQTMLDSQRQGPLAEEMPRARTVPDARTNSVLVTASDAQHADVMRLIGTLDQTLEDKDLKLEIIRLQNASSLSMQKVIEQVVVGRNPALKERVQVSAQEGSNVLVVRAPAEQIGEIKEIVAKVDTAEVPGLPIRFVKLERADAQTVATALQKFFQERAQASSRGGQRGVNRVAVTGDRKSGSLIISSSDEDYEQIKSLVATFDAPAKAKQMQLKIVPLQHARVTDISETLDNLAWELRSERMRGFYFWSPWGNDGDNDSGGEDKLYVQTNERINSVVVMGQGDTMETMLRVISELDRPQAEQTKLVVRSVRVDRGDLNAMANMIRQVTATPGWRSWQGPDPDGVAAQVDQARRVILLVGKLPRVEQAIQYVNEMKGTTGREQNVMETLTLRHAQAPRAAETLRRVFKDRAESQGLPEDAVSVVGSTDGNLLMISADAESMKVAKDLIAMIDQPELGKDRRIEVYGIRNREADELATLIRAQFPRGQGGGRQDAQVIVTAQPSTNSLIVSAMADDQPEVQALIKQLDAAPSEDASRLITVNLKSARADDVASALKSALPEGLKVKVTPVRRNNTLLLTGSDETIKIVMEQIARIDIEVERSPVEFKRVQLKHAMSPDVAFTVEQMLMARPRVQGEPVPSVDYTRSDNTISFSGTTDQIRDIDKMIAALDVASETKKRTEFVKLEFAKADQTAKALEVFYGRFAPAANTPAAQNVAIVPDMASNSLVISADEAEWEGLRGLLKKLDTEEYDTSRQLAVIPLKHADAQSVARALNEGFRAPTAERLRREQGRQGNQGNRRPQDEQPEPMILVDNEPTPSVSAEQLTNSLVIFAGRKDLVRIKAMVEQIDVPDFVKYAEAHVLPLKSGKASQIAASVRELFVGQRVSGPQGGAGGPRATVIVGDDTSNSLIIRAEERDFAQIKALAEVLQQQGAISQATVRVLTVRNIPAARLVKTLETTFAQAAKQQNEVLSIEVDRTSNSLVIAASKRIYDQIEEVVRELDGGVVVKPDQVQGPMGALGQSVTIIDIVNNAPEDVRKQLEALGVTKAQPGDRPGVVSEPVTIVSLSSRRAIAVVAGPQDGEAVRSLVKAIDADPINAEQKVAIVGLKMATASAVVQTLTEMLKPDGQASQTGAAKALAEQVRRLSIANNTVGKGDHALDLSKPIRLIADVETNSVIVGSTEANVASVLEVIKTLDTLPIGDAVVVRIFPLSNASATRAKSVVDDLFKQGEALRRLPGTRRQGLPTTATGRALAGEIAVSVDDRTNTLVVAGREEAVALVEIVIKDLDGDQASKWIEPTLIPLKNADAVTMATMLKKVLVQGLTLTPEAVGLQKQVGRLRMARSGRDLNDPANRVEADLFAPLSGLVIEPEAQLNALIVVGSTANIQVVKELVSLMDVEAASAANTVRIFPLQRAAADRVAAMVGNLFRQRQEDPAAKDEDRVILAADARTNALIVSTSPKSFSILESMLKALDTEQANSTVGLHVVPVTGANVEQLAPKIDKLMKERIAASQRSGEVRSPLDTFSIESDVASNLLIVASSEENLQLVKELVKTLSEGSAVIAGAARTDVIQLKSGRASDVATTLRQLYVDKENAKRGTDSVGVLPNERLNALVVTGTDSDIEQMRALVTRLESAGIATAQDIRRISLRSANAIEVVQLLQSVLAGRPVSGGADIAARQATNIRFFRDKVAAVVEGQVGIKPTEAQVDGAIREQVTLTPDLRTNSVMVKAPPEVMEVIKAIVEDLDTTSAGARRIEQFTLKNADVRQMADLLRDIFTLRQQGNKYVLVPTQGPTPGPGETGPAPEQGTMTPVPDERQELSIAIDARTNTLIVSGTEEYLGRVRQLVTDLDQIEAQERTQQIYAVRNAKAKEIETTLQNYFKGESGLTRSLLGPDQSGSAMRQLEQEVTVVGDEKSNRLLVSTSPRYIDAVMRMVKELDTAPPQVMIQVLLAEVTVDSADTWGSDVRIKDIGGSGFTFAGLAAGAGVATALGVPNLTFTSTDFDLILRALEAQGKLQVLSSPHIVARNNQVATINVGDNIAIVQSVERTPQGGTVADVKREDLGIKLNVTPSISPDGFVRMDLIPEIQTLSQRTTQISEDFAAPVINKRTLQTTVTVKDGQTVVLGGLMQTTQDERRTKVPILGDLWLVGSLFRSSQKSDAKTELLMIVTPRVIYNDEAGSVEQFRSMTERKIDALDNPGAVRDSLKRNGIGEPTEGPGLEPESFMPVPAKDKP